MIAAFALSFMAHCGNVTINKSFAQEGRPQPPPVLPSMKGDTVLVAGATGRVGKQVVEMLLAQGVKVKGTARDAAKAKADQPNVEWIQTEFKNLDTVKNLAKGIGAVMRWKNELEKHIRKSGVSYTVVRPVGLWDKQRGENPIALIPGDVQVPGMVTRGDVALVVVDALANPDAKGKSFTMFNVTHPDLTGWKSAFAKLPKD